MKVLTLRLGRTGIKARRNRAGAVTRWVVDMSRHMGLPADEALPQSSCSSGCGNTRGTRARIQ
jgi:hypothetical protein